MDTEDNTNEEAAESEDSAGLLDRYDELFEADGEAKAGTESLLSEEAESDEAEGEVKVDPEADAETEAEVHESTPEDSPETEAEEEKDAFDAETAAKIKEMDTDSHHGIKFSELRNELKELQNEVQNYKDQSTQTEEFQGMKLKAERADNLETELRELQRQLSVVEYKATPEYKTQVEKPRNDLRELSEIIEKSNSIESGEVYRAVNMSDQTSQNRAIDALVEQHELSRRDETRMYAMADDIIKVNATDEHLKGVADKRMGELNEMEVTATAEADAKTQKQVDDAISQTLNRYEGKLPGFVTEDGLANDIWEQVAQTTKDSSIGSPQDEAHAIFAANAMPHMLDHIKHLSSQLKDKNVLLSRYTKAKPSKDVAPKTSEDKKVDDTASFLDRLNTLKF